MLTGGMSSFPTPFSIGFKTIPVCYAEFIKRYGRGANSFVSLVRPVISWRSKMGFMRPLRPYGGTYHPKFNFATVDQLTQEAQAAGLVVEKCYDFERPTPLKAGEQGLANWARQFFASELASFSPVEQDEILARLAARVRDELWDGHQWVADYRRIRCVAHKD